MFKRLLPKNYNATICDITLQASQDSVELNWSNRNHQANTGAQEGLNGQHKKI